MSAIVRLQVRLLKAPDEAPVFAEAYQAELQQFKQHLQAAGLEVSPIFAVFHSSGAGRGLTGQFLLSWAATGVSIVGTVGVVAVAWMKGRAGRQLRLTVGDVELQANHFAEIEHLLIQAIMLKAQQVKQAAPT